MQRIRKPESKQEREALIAAIRTCKTRAQLGKIFERFDVKSPKVKYNVLQKAMYNPQTFGPERLETPEEKLEMQIQIFLAGAWRISEVYDKLGPDRKKR